VQSIEMGAQLEDMGGTIHAHPTLGEAVQEAALRRWGTRCISDAHKNAGGWRHPTRACPRCVPLSPARSDPRRGQTACFYCYY
jgi:hypothetical protein